MVGWLQHGSILHGLNPQIIPKDSQAVLTSQNTTKIHQDSPSDTPRHPQTASDTIGTTVYLQKRSRLFIWCISISYMRSWMKVEPSYHFSTPVKCNIFFRLIILRHQNTKTAAKKLSKNHWVWPFFAIFRLLREILLVTVAFDHTVSWVRYQQYILFSREPCNPQVAD